MRNERYKKAIVDIICNTIVDECSRRQSCRLVFFSQKDKLKNMLIQIRSSKDFKLTEWEVCHIIEQKSYKIQADNMQDYPSKNANATQIEQFAKQVADCLADYFATDHHNEIKLSIHGLSEEVKNYLNGKTIPNGKFFIETQNNNLSILLAVNGPLVDGGENAEVIRLNELYQAILSVGCLLYFFDISPLDEKAFYLDRISIEHQEDYFQIENLFSKEIKELSERISFMRAADTKIAEIFLNTLSKILNNNTYSNDVLYSLTWYSQSLNGGDIKTKFICRYIGFEILSGIWTRTDINDKSSQDKIKYSISALLAEDIDDVKNKEKLLNDAIELRNDLFHGNRRKEQHDAFGRRMSQQYARLGTLYRNLFLHTVSKI